MYRGDRHCVDQIRMSPLAFEKIYDLLVLHNLLQATTNMPIREQLLIFLEIIGHNTWFCFIAGVYYRSIQTIHHYFRIVLKAILNLYKHLIIDPANWTPPEIMNNQRFYPYFKVISNFYSLFFLVFIWRKSVTPFRCHIHVSEL